MSFEYRSESPFQSIDLEPSSKHAAQKTPLGTSHLILEDSLVRVLQNLRSYWITTVMAFGGAMMAHLFRMVELMNPGRIPNVMILVGTDSILRKRHNGNQ